MWVTDHNILFRTNAKSGLYSILYSKEFGT